MTQSSPMRWGSTLLLTLLCACAHTHPYVGEGENNVRFVTSTEAESIFSSVSASVDIYSIDADCHTDYLGNIELDAGNVSTALPVDQRLYLVFSFKNSSFLGSGHSRIDYKTMLTPKRHTRYDIEVSYKDETYRATIEELGTAGSTAKEIAFNSLDEVCSHAAQ